MRRIRTTLLAAGLVLAPELSTAVPHDDLHERIAALDARIEARPEDAGLRLRRAELHRLHEDFDRAVADLERARALRPGWPELSLFHARICLDQGWTRSAEQLVVAFLKVEPEREDALSLRAEILAARGDWPSATAAFESLVANSDAPQPDHFLAWARAARRSGDETRERALAVLDRGVERLGPVPALHLAAMELELEGESFDAALARVDALMATSRRRERWLALRGEVLLRAQRPEAARAAYLEARSALGRLSAKQRNTRAMTELSREIEAALEALARD